MRCVNIYKHDYSFVVETDIGRWWLVQDGNRFIPFIYCEESDLYSKCSRLDYLSATSRDVDKDLRALWPIVVESWKAGTAIEHCVFMTDFSGKSTMRAFFSKRSRSYSIEPDEWANIPNIGASTCFEGCKPLSNICLDFTY